MSEPEQKWENNASFKQINTLKMFIAFKMAYSCCFSFGGNLDFPEFLQKSFILSTTDGYIVIQSLAIYNSDDLSNCIKMPKLVQHFAKY